MTVLRDRVCAELAGGEGRRAVIMQSADEHGCPRCGVVVGGKPYDVRESRTKGSAVLGAAAAGDLAQATLPLSGIAVRAEVFVERSDEIMPGRRTSGRLRPALARAAARAAAGSSARYRRDPRPAGALELRAGHGPLAS